MKPRKERVAEFMANIDSLSPTRLRVACYIRKTHLPEFNDMAIVIAALKEEFAEKPESWIIDDIAEEYNRIANMSDHNLQIWANYRRNANAEQPIAKANGDFIEVKIEGIKVTIDGVAVTINDYDFASIETNCGDGETYWTNMSFAAMEKMLQIKSHWLEIKRLVE